LPALHTYFSLLLSLCCIVPSPRLWAQIPDNSLQKKGEKELIALHEEDRRAHFQHDIPALLSHIGAELIDVHEGKVSKMGATDVRKRFTDYFLHAEFSAWDDLDPPIVRVSADGQVGWMIVRVRITYTETDQQGKKTLNDSVMAWMASYQKQAGCWIMTAVTSTSQTP